MVGFDEEAAVGDAEGLGVGDPGTYVGVNVGRMVGASVGKDDGKGVGAPGPKVG